VSNSTAPGDPWAKPRALGRPDRCLARKLAAAADGKDYSEQQPRPKSYRDLIDPDDPALPHILQAAMDLDRFGFDISDLDNVRRIIEVGRKSYADLHATESRAVSTREGRMLTDITNSVVYYMRIGNRVKIGFTTNLSQRLTQINPEELMATEPGDTGLEQRRHGQFRELRTHGEWFRLEGALADHIAELVRRAPTT
jgi:hypothetical protein